MILNRTRLLVVSFYFLLVDFQCSGMAYVPIARAGQTSQQLANTLRLNILGAANPREVGQIIAAEIANNDVSCQLGPQTTLLSQHLREHGHWNDTYALVGRRGAYAPASRYATAVANLNVVALDTIVADLLNLLLSGRVSFSVGVVQGAIHGYAFMLYANITNHGIANLAVVSGLHNGVNTDHLRVVFRFMDRLRAELDTLGLPDQQLNIITMFHENPTSVDLAASILPAGVGPAPGLVPLGIAIGALPGGGAPDNRVPPVAPIPAPPLVAAAPVHHWYHIFAFGNWFH